MLPVRHFLLLAAQAMLRNRMQTTLAMLGVMVGVGALVTSVALGRGAQQAIHDQLVAAGANMIVVTAGNYQVQRPQGVEDPASHQAALWRPASPFSAARWDDGRSVARGLDARTRLYRVHFEDDPMAVHDHPTAKERLGDSMAGLGSAATLTREDAEAIRDEIPGVQFVASGVHENARLAVVGSDAKWFTRLHGTESELPVIRRGWTFPHGRFLTRANVAKSEQVMVLGRYVADRLFGEGKDPLGRKVVLWNQAFEVVGVVGSRSWAVQPTAGDDQFDAVYVPVTTLHRLLNLSRLNSITVTTASAGDTTRIAGEITKLLRARHGISEQMADDFSVKTQAQQLLGKGLPPDLARAVAGNMGSVDTMTIETLSSSLQRANWTMLALLTGVATVSLLVGGIGVMNLLLLSVTQRTSEVGLRMALGARGRDVALHFLFEAVLLCVCGGVLGALVGVLASNGLERVFAWSAIVSPWSAALAVLVAIALGVVSGVYPARRASQLDPIQALHHEM